MNKFILMTCLTVSLSTPSMATEAANDSCSTALSPVGKMVRLVRDLSDKKWNRELMQELEPQLSLKEKMELIDLAVRVAPKPEEDDSELSEKKTDPTAWILERIFDELNIPFSAILDHAAAHPEYLDFYLTPERLKQLQTDSTPENRLQVYKAFLSVSKQSGKKVSDKNLKELFPKESDRLELAQYYSQILRARGDIGVDSAEITSEQKGYRIFEMAETFSITSPQATLALARTYLNLDALYANMAGSKWNIQIRGYSNKSREQALAKFHAWVKSWPENDRNIFAVEFVERARPMKLVYMENIPALFGIKDVATLQALRVGVLKMFIKRWGDGFRFEDTKKAFVASGLSKDSVNLVLWSLEYDNFSKHVPYDSFIQSVHNMTGGHSLELRKIFSSKEFQHKVLLQYGLQTFPKPEGINDLGDLPLRPEANRAGEVTLVKVIQEWEESHPGIIPGYLVPTLLEGTGDRDTFIYLFNQSLKHLDTFNQKKPADFFELLATIYPWNVESIKKWGKSGRYEVLAIATEIYELTEKDIFTYLPLDPSDFPSADKLANLLENVRNNFVADTRGKNTLKPTKRNPKPAVPILENVVKELVSTELGYTVSESKIDQLIELSKRLFIERVRTAMDVKKYGIDFSYEDLMKLNEEWTDIEPILTLFMRVDDNVKPLILEIFKESLAGTFDSFKFDHKDAKSQVGFLTPKQLRAWRTPRLRISSPGVDKKSFAIEEIKEKVDQMLEKDLLKPLQNSEIWDQVSRKQNSEKFGHLAESLNGDPIAAIEQYLKEDGKELAAERMAGAGLQLLGDANYSIYAKRNVAKILAFLFSRNLADKLGEAKALLSEKLKEIERSIPKVNSSEFESQGLVISVIDSSPRLAMTVGDLICGAHTCQSAKTGKKAFVALPAYVADANVQVMASFHVEGRHFKNHQEYRAALTGLGNKDLKSVSFNGNKRTFTFILSNGEKIETNHLGYAFRRQILKLGYVENKSGKPEPSLRLETAYEQNSELQKWMVSNHQQLFDDLVTEMGAVQNKTMTIPASRNPAGVYSDLGVLKVIGESKIRLGPYKMEPQSAGN